MTQSENELLTTDLSARFPYGVKISIPDLWTAEKYVEVLNEIFKGDDGQYRVNDSGLLIKYVKPYLFPLSSIPKKQKDEFDNKMIKLALQALNDEIDSNEVTSFEIDFYHKNHIDWRGLIPMGLAIDATNLNIY